MCEEHVTDWHQTIKYKARQIVHWFLFRNEDVSTCCRINLVHSLLTVRWSDLPGWFNPFTDCVHGMISQSVNYAQPPVTGQLETSEREYEQNQFAAFTWTNIIFVFL